MYEKFLPYKPAVRKNVLYFIAGAVWIGVGMLLLLYAFQWLASSQIVNAILFGFAGITAGIIIRKYGFIKLVDKNLKRIGMMNETVCVFSFISWKSYLNVIFMVGLGIMLRHSAIPKLFLSPVYLGIGLALFLSGFRYFKVLFFAGSGNL